MTKRFYEISREFEWALDNAIEIMNQNSSLRSIKIAVDNAHELHDQMIGCMCSKELEWLKVKRLFNIKCNTHGANQA